MRESIIREVTGNLETSCISVGVAITDFLKLSIKESGEYKLLMVNLTPKEARKIIKDLRDELTRRNVNTPKPRKYKVKK